MGVSLDYHTGLHLGTKITRNYFSDRNYARSNLGRLRPFSPGFYMCKKWVSCCLKLSRFCLNYFRIYTVTEALFRLREEKRANGGQFYPGLAASIYARFGSLTQWMQIEGIKAPSAGICSTHGGIWPQKTHFLQTDLIIHIVTQIGA